MSGDKEFGAYLALFSAVIFWGISFVATKIALESIPTFTLILARFALAGCVFLILMVLRGFPRLTRKDHGKIILIALCEPGLYFTFETIGLQYTTAPMASLIIATIPVAVFILAALFLGERTRLVGIVGMVASLAGIAILITADPHFTWSVSGHLLGDLLIFGAVLSAAFYMVCARSLGKNRSAMEFTGLQTIYGALLFVPAFLWELPEVRWAEMTMRSVAAVGFLTLFATIGAFLCYNHALTRLPATRAAIFINGIPVVTALSAWVLLGEWLTVVQMSGGAMVLAGVFLANSYGAREVSPELKGLIS
ncbi:MAG: DMT family transporter [Deltaproteobacteria bacterium]|nr:DMT family transporter [Deltaproteobacteria bacterium]